MLQQGRGQDAGGDGVGVGQDDVVGDLLAGRDEGQRQAVFGLQGRGALNAVPMLCPSGTAEFEGVRLPVVSDGGFVPPGTAVQVVTVQGNRIVVRPEEG